MLKSLLITSITIVSSTLTDYECPATTTSLGPVGTRFDKSVRDLYSERMDPGDTIDDCETLCRSDSRCVAFEFSYACSWWTVYNQCSLYSTDGPVTLPTTPSFIRRWARFQSYDKAGSCAITMDQFCPPGTTQPGTEGQWPGFPALPTAVFQIGNEVAPTPQVTLTLEDCNLECCNDDDCDAYSYVDTEVGGNQVTFCFGWDDSHDLDAVEELPASTLRPIFTCEQTADSCNTLDCPSGTTEAARGKQVNGRLVAKHFHMTVEECAEECRCNEDCFTFTYDDDVGGDTSFCGLYETATVGADIDASSLYVELITCQVESCPDGSSQIGGPGDVLDPANYISFTRGLTIQGCKAACAADSNCAAFTFDFDIYAGWYIKWLATYNPNADNGCWLYSSADRATQAVRWSARDAVSCEMDSGSSARSPGLDFEFEPYNDMHYGQYNISVYIIYGVIGLILVNIMCLIINCWRKNGGGKRYKVVSIRSEEDSTEV